MKLFRFIRNLLKTIGLTVPSDQTNQQRCSFNFKNIFILICIIELTISSILYFLFEVRTLDERSESFYTCLSEISCLVDFMANMWKVPKMIKAIERIEKFIKNREWTLFIQKESGKNSFILLCDRINNEFISIWKIEWKNRKNVWSHVFLSHWVDFNINNNGYTTLDNYQLFCLQFGRRIVYFAVFGHVCFPKFKKSFSREILILVFSSINL